MSGHADTIRPLLAAMGTGYATPEDYDAALAALDALLAENQRLRDRAQRLLAVLDTYGEGNFAEVDDLREALDERP